MTRQTPPRPSAADAALRKAADLRRMQRIATGLLAAMLALLLGCALLQARAARLGLPPAPWVECQPRKSC